MTGGVGHLSKDEELILAHPIVTTDPDPEHGLPPGFGEGLWGKALIGVALAFSAFQLFTAVYAILPSQVLRAVHVAFLLLLASALIGNLRSSGSGGKLLGWALGLVAFAANIYQWVFYTDLVNRAGDLTKFLDFIVGVTSITVLFVIAWRLLGPALPIVTGGFLAYCLFGHLLPAPLNHRGFDAHQVVEQMAFAPRAFTPCRPPCRRPISSCSSCSARFWSAPA